METKKLEELINLLSKGDTAVLEVLFAKPGGRKFLENIVLVIITSLPHPHDEKEKLFIAFHKVLDKMSSRIKRKKDGERILKQIYQ